jgi:hypothetical protein
MKRLIIICEGQTEQAFCEDVLRYYFITRNIYIEAPTIKKTGGGIVNWAALKYQIEKHLSEDVTAFVSCLIDYYGIHPHHKYPFWAESINLKDKNQAMGVIENAMYVDVNSNRFIPYIQLHEFEGLLFSDISLIQNSYESVDYEYLQTTIADFSNPEMINNSAETAPSKRLSRIIKGYNKIIDGSLLAQEIGLDKIREKCPRFNDWISKLEQI